MVRNGRPAPQPQTREPVTPNPEETVLIWRTDVHLADDTPRSRADVWSDTVLNKLVHVGELAREYGAAAVIDGGDFFNIKSPGRNSHALIQRVLAAHRDYPCPVYANVGNHDCVYGDYSFLPQQPLGVLYESGVFRRLYDHHEVTVGGGAAPRVRVTGIPYHGTTYDMGRFERIERGPEDYLVTAAHLLASPTETKMFEGEDIIRYDRLDGYAPDVYMFGHWHKDQGVATTDAGKTIVNIGSLTRGSLSQDDLERTPSVAVLRFSRAGLTVHKVPVRHEPAQVVFDLARHAAAEVREDALADFTSTLAKTLSTPAAERTLGDTIRAEPGVPEKVRELALSYVEAAGGS